MLLVREVELPNEGVQIHGCLISYGRIDPLRSAGDGGVQNEPRGRALVLQLACRTPRRILYLVRRT